MYSAQEKEENKNRDRIHKIEYVDLKVCHFIGLPTPWRQFMVRFFEKK